MQTYMNKGYPGKSPGGYRHNSAGVVPDGWQEYRLGELGTFYKGKGVLKEDLAAEGKAAVHYSAIYESKGVAYEENGTFVDNKREYDSPEAIYGDILMAGTGENPRDIGKCMVYLCEKSAYAGSDIIILRPDKTVVDSLYLGYLLNEQAVQKQKTELSQGHSVVHLYMKHIKKLKVVLPPLYEQERISRMILIWDRAILLKSQLIEQYEKQKAYLQKILLTGQVRLSGFWPAWKQMNLGQLCGKIMGGGTPPRDDPSYFQGEIPWATVKDLHGHRKKEDTHEYVVQKAVEDKFCRLIPPGNLIVATRMGLGRGFINSVEMATNQDLKGLIVDTSLVDVEFLYYAYTFQHKRINRLGSGSTVKGLNLSALKKIPVGLPSLAEQRAIVKILSGLDEIITVHVQLRGELKRQKQALHQLLLTGLVRTGAPFEHGYMVAEE